MMKTNEFENKIKESFSKRTPDVLDRIMASCESETQLDAADIPSVVKGRTGIRHTIVKYASFAASFVLIFTLGILIGNMMKSNSHDPGATGELDYASIYLDVNPSIEIVVDEEGTVGNVIAGNADAEAVLLGMDLAGVSVKTALNAIIGSMYMNGYFTDDSSAFLVSMSADADEKFETLLSTVVSDVTDIVESSGKTCSIVAQDFDADDDTLLLAKKNNVSPGKMSLIEKIIGSSEDYSEEDIEELSRSEIKDLNEIYAFLDSKKGDENEGGGHKSDIISGVLDWMDGDKTSAFKLALLALSESLDSMVGEDVVTDVKIDVKHDPDKGGIGFSPVFIYRISFTYEGVRYSYDINLGDGTVVEREDENEKGDEAPTHTGAEPAAPNKNNAATPGKPVGDEDISQDEEIGGGGTLPELPAEDGDEPPERDNEKDKNEVIEDIFSGLIDKRP